MNENRAKEILGEWIVPSRPSGTQICSADSRDAVVWHPVHGDIARVDGEFTADQLEAIAWWMRNKSGN